MEDGSDAVYLTSTESRRFRFVHVPDCCSTGHLVDVNGDPGDLIGNPIVMANEVSSGGHCTEDFESLTWTFYHLATIKGIVTLRWLGKSNGYYSEEIDLEEWSAEEHFYPPWGNDPTKKEEIHP